MSPASRYCKLQAEYAQEKLKRSSLWPSMAAHRSYCRGRPIKATTPQAIEDLQRLGIKVIMLTGDNAYTAHAVAKQLNIDEVHAGVAPQDKNSLINALRHAGHVVAMAGDGINDAPALALPMSASRWAQARTWPWRAPA